MCNLYSMTRNQEAIRRLFKVTRDSAGNLPSMPGIFPDKEAPVIRQNGAERELLTMRWGMPSSSDALFRKAKDRAAKLEAKGKTVDFKELLRMEPDKGTTNVRNTKSKHWIRWLGTDNRVLIRSDRYPAQPLLIQGPGAGAEVTAAALLDDVLRISAG